MLLYILYDWQDFKAQLLFALFALVALWKRWLLPITHYIFSDHVI
jgi:hypothetical protein